MFAQTRRMNWEMSQVRTGTNIDNPSVRPPGPAPFSFRAQPRPSHSGEQFVSRNVNLPAWTRAGTRFDFRRARSVRMNYSRVTQYEGPLFPSHPVINRNERVIFPISRVVRPSRCDVRWFSVFSGFKRPGWVPPRWDRVPRCDPACEFPTFYIYIFIFPTFLI